jgi:ribose transport system substrate-binding protein
MVRDPQFGRRRPADRRRRRPALIVAFLAALVLVLAACGGNSNTGSSSGGSGSTAAAGGDSGKQKTIAVSFPNASKEGAVQFEMNFARAKAKEMGYKFILDDPQGDLNRQVSTIKTWINQRVDSIVTVALDPNVFESVAQQARAKGIKWITYGSALKNQDGQIDLQQQIGGRTIGKLAGEWITKNLNATAKVALLTYEKGDWARQRRQGVEAGLKEAAPNAKIVARQDALSETEGLNVTNTLLQAHPDLNAVLAIEETATEGAYEAFIRKGHAKNDPKVFLAGIDGTIKALKLLEAGDTMYRGSAALSLKSIGEGIVTEADRLIKGGSGPFKLDYTPLTPGSPDIAKHLAEWQG